MRVRCHVFVVGFLLVGLLKDRIQLSVTFMESKLGCRGAYFIMEALVQGVLNIVRGLLAVVVCGTAIEVRVRIERRPVVALHCVGVLCVDTSFLESLTSVAYPDFFLFLFPTFISPCS